MFLVTLNAQNTSDEVCLKKNGEIRPPGPPSFKKKDGELTKLAAGHLGHRIELSCPHHKGCPSAKVVWTKDSLPVVERDKQSGLSTIRILRNGGLIIEVSRILLMLLISFD